MRQIDGRFRARRAVLVVGLAAAAALLLAIGTRRSGDEGGVPRLASDHTSASSVTEPAQGYLSNPAESATERQAVNAEESVQPTASSPSRQLRIEVVYADGAPAQDATIAVFDAQTVFDHAICDSEGRVEFELAEGPIDLVVLRDSAVLCVVKALEASPDEQRVVIPGPYQIDGVVRVQGMPPEQVLAIRVYSADESGGVSDPPAIVAEYFNWRGFSGMPMFRAFTDATGYFSFMGLGEGWHGHILAPTGYRFSTGEDVLILPGPQRNLLLEFVREPTLTGRIVDQAGIPVDDATVRYDLSCPSGTETYQITTDVLGRFDIPLRCGDRYSVDIDAGKEGVGLGHWHFEELARPAWGERHDLGDLPLASVREVLAVVRDMNGTPIAGAVLRPVDRMAMKSWPSAADGTVSLQVPMDCSTLRIDALGYVSAEMPVTGAMMDVMLVLGSNLAISCEATGDLSFPAGLIVLAQERVFSTGDGISPDELQVELGASPTKSRRAKMLGDEQVELALEFGFTPEGRVVLTNLLPGARLTVKAMTADGEEWEMIHPIAPSQGWQEVTLSRVSK